MDWPTIMAEFDRRFAGRTVRSRKAVVEGSNFMTPDHLGVVVVGTTVAEITTGTGFRGERIFGVTFPRLADGKPDPRDGVHFSLDEVEAALQESSDA